MYHSSHNEILLKALYYLHTLILTNRNNRDFMKIGEGEGEGGEPVGHNLWLERVEGRSKMDGGGDVA